MEEGVDAGRRPGSDVGGELAWPEAASDARRGGETGEELAGG